MKLKRFVSVNAFLVVVVAIWSSLTAVEAESSELEILQKQAAQNYQTKEGQLYFERFEKAIMPIFGAALKTCSSSTADTKEPADIVFVVAANGQIKQLLYSKNIPFGNCLGSKLQSLSTLPRPPRDSWVVALGVANHQHEEKSKGPPDTPLSLTTQDRLTAYDKAIAPYIAKARATYPSAKRRFLAGLPSGHKFSVRVPLIDRDSKREDSFVRVESIHGENITGIIESNLKLITNYKMGQRITFPESKIDNWVILRPDGTEEGNFVGKFLDHYKPR